MGPVQAAGAEVVRLENQLMSAKVRLATLELQCFHVWDEPKYTPIIHDGYQDPGDPPGTMGVDRQLPCWIPRQEIPLWTRTCGLCGMVDTTQKVRDDIKKVPVF